MQRRGALVGIGFAAWAGRAAATGVAPAYEPAVVDATGKPERWMFDLKPALARARREGKRLFVYLGADDCPFCRKYEAFLAANAAALVPHFRKQYLVIELRSTLKVQADRLHFDFGTGMLGYTAAMKALGDERERQLVYPSVWLLDGQGKPLMQMPAGTGTFETVEEQIEVLNLVQ